MLHIDVIFDINQKRLGFAEAQCPSYWKRPPPPSGVIQVHTAKDVAKWVESFVVEESVLGVYAGVLLVSCLGCGLATVWRHVRIATKRARSLAQQAATPAVSAQHSIPDPIPYQCQCKH